MDRHLLAVLGEHQVLTTGQLVRLAGMPERTVQHRLGALYRAGLVSRSRPRAAVGTSPYHVWLTANGAEAVGAGPPDPWSEDPAGVRTVAALSELWLGLRDHGPAAGLTLADWRRLPDGFSYRDPHTGADRRLAAGAELRVRLGAVELRALVFARVDRIPRARLGPVLARWDTYLAAPASASVPTAALVLTRTARQRAAVLEAARGVLGPPARALLSVAAEVHAERGEVRRATCPAQVTTLRMGTRGLRHPVRAPGVSGLVPPALLSGRGLRSRPRT